jgi:hypothetical protein
LSKKSKDKGNRGENAVARLLGEWWGKLEPRCEFCRTPGSGGWATGTLRSFHNVSGDLTTTAQMFPFTTEIKWREAWSVERFLFGKTSPVWGWWRQAVNQALEDGHVPMLWARKNRLEQSCPELSDCRVATYRLPYFDCIRLRFLRARGNCRRKHR